MPTKQINKIWFNHSCSSKYHKTKDISNKIEVDIQEHF